MAKTTIIIEIEYPDEMIPLTIAEVLDKRPDMDAGAAGLAFSNEELAVNGFNAVLLERIGTTAGHSDEPFLRHGGGYTIEAKNAVAGRSFDFTASVTVSDGEELN